MIRGRLRLPYTAGQTYLEKRADELEQEGLALRGYCSRRNSNLPQPCGALPAFVALQELGLKQAN